MSDELPKVIGTLHYQVVADCPKCGEMTIEDLGEFPSFDGSIMTCSACGEDFELIEES